jgi:hypothetical protein
VNGKTLNYYIDNGKINSSCITIEYLELNPPNDSFGYVENCQLSAKGTLNAVQNLPQMLDKFYSIHVCANSDFIPFAFIKTDG